MADQSIHGGLPDGQVVMLKLDYTDKHGNTLFHGNRLRDERGRTCILIAVPGVIRTRIVHDWWLVLEHELELIAVQQYLKWNLRPGQQALNLELIPMEA